MSGDRRRRRLTDRPKLQLRWYSGTVTRRSSEVETAAVKNGNAFKCLAPVVVGERGVEPGSFLLPRTRNR